MAPHPSGWRNPAAVACLTLLPIVLIASYSYMEMRSQLTRAALARRESIAEMASAMLMEKFTSLEELGVSLATRVQFRRLVQDGRWEEAIDILRAIPEHFPYIDRIFLTNLEGTLLADVPEVPEMHGKNFAHRNWFQGVQAGWRPYVSDIYQRAAPPQHTVIAVAVPINGEDGGRLGILVLQARLATLFDWANQITLGESGLVYFVDPRGTVAGHRSYPPDGPMVSFLDVPSVQAALRGERGVLIAVNPVEGVERVSAYAPVAGFGWGAVMVEPTRTAFASRDRSLQLLLMFFAVSLLTGIVMIGVLSFPDTERRRTAGAGWIAESGTPGVQADPVQVALLRGLARAAGAAGVALGVGVLMGWIFDIPSLKSVFPGLATMKANTALAFLLSGIALGGAGSGSNPWPRRAARVCAALTVLIGLVTLGEYLLGWNPGIDEWLFRDLDARIGAGSPGRMALVTAANFSCIGIALLAGSMGGLARIRLAQALALVVVFLAVLGLLGYLLGIEALYHVGPYGSVALHTALGLAVIALGILASHPDQGLMAVVSSASIGGIAARRVLPAAILAPVVLGWLRWKGQETGLYETEFGLAAFITANIVVLTSVVWWNAKSLQRIDAARQHSESRFRLVVESAPNAMVLVNREGGIAMVNGQTERLFGYSRSELLGQSIETLVPERFRRQHSGYRGGFFHAPQARPMGAGRDLYARRKDGSEFPVEIGLNPIDAPGGTQVLAAIIDITERKRNEERMHVLNAELETRVRERTAQLEASNKELEAFSYSVSHDLRAPLRAIDGFSRAIEEDCGPRLDDEGRRLLGIVRTNVHRMGQLIDDLLAFSRVGRQQMVASDIDMRGLAKLAMDDLRLLHPSRAIELQLGDLPKAMGDHSMLRQVWLNLLSNAIKFSGGKPAAVIDISGRVEGGLSVYTVKDRGAGFDMRYVDKLFGIFQRLHGQDEFEGTGVGLAIVQRIVHRLGGRVWAESVLGEGATFHFALPTGGKPA